MVSFISEIYGEDVLDQTSAYHMSEAYVSKKVHDPDTMTYLESLTSNNEEHYWNLMDG